MARLWGKVTIVLIGLAQPTWAGPPFVSDDPEPTDYKHYEIYTFNSGTVTRDGLSGATGIAAAFRTRTKPISIRGTPRS